MFSSLTYILGRWSSEKLFSLGCFFLLDLHLLIYCIMWCFSFFLVSITCFWWLLVWKILLVLLVKTNKLSIVFFILMSEGVMMEFFLFNSFSKGKFVLPLKSLEGVWCSISLLFYCCKWWVIHKLYTPIPNDHLQNIFFFCETFAGWWASWCLDLRTFFSRYLLCKKRESLAASSFWSVAFCSGLELTLEVVFAVLHSILFMEALSWCCTFS